MDKPAAQELMGSHPFFNGQRDQEPSHFPKADIVQNETEIVVIAELPGVQKEDIQLSLGDEHLHLKGTVRPIAATQKFYLSERHGGEFQRSFLLPVRVEARSIKIRASLRDGLLTVRIPIPQVWRKEIQIED